MKLENENVDSGKSINTSSALNSQSIFESKKGVNHGNSRETQKEFNAKDSSEAISDEKSKERQRWGPSMRSKVSNILIINNKIIPKLKIVQQYKLIVFPL